MHATSLTWCWRLVAEERRAPYLITFIIPNFTEALFQQVAHLQTFIVICGKGTDTAGQAVAIGCDVSCRPWAKASVPGLLITHHRRFQTPPWVSRAGGS